MKSEKLQKNNQLIKTLAIIFSAVAVFFFILYLYFVGSTIFNIVERKNAEQSIAQLNSRISQLELKYLSLNNQINIEMAERQGFIKAGPVIFASERSFVQNVTLRQDNEL